MRRYDEKVQQTITKKMFRMTRKLIALGEVYSEHQKHGHCVCEWCKAWEKNNES